MLQNENKNVDIVTYQPILIILKLDQLFKCSSRKTGVIWNYGDNCFKLFLGKFICTAGIYCVLLDKI